MLSSGNNDSEEVIILVTWMSNSCVSMMECYIFYETTVYSTHKSMKWEFIFNKAEELSSKVELGFS